MEYEQNNSSNEKIYNLYEQTKIFETLCVGHFVQIVKKISIQFFNQIYSLSKINKSFYLFDFDWLKNANKNKSNKKVHFDDKSTYYSEKILNETVSISSEENNTLNEITCKQILNVSFSDDEWGWFVDLDYQ